MDWRDQLAAWVSSVWPWGSIFGASFVGRVMYRAGICRRGDRRFWSWSLAWELPLAVGMGIIAAGMAEFLDLGIRGTLAVSTAVAYLGPRGIEAYLERFLEKRARQ
ncbi:phage holin family protein [Nisaea nitritireducens]|uniref:phage holin family protein n=1 Tax=Nisaea nitritireducens TaxID=568392 RepID=UPI0018674CDE|nr:phage holin family protein [Nisaea nitritireducens]